MLMKDLPAEWNFMVGHLAARKADRSLRRLSQPLGKFTEVDKKSPSGTKS